MTKKNLLIILISLLVLIACKNKNTENQSPVARSGTNIDSLTVEMPIDTLEFLKDFKIEQLDEHKFILKPGDTVDFKKPTIKLFTGKIEDENVQLCLVEGYNLYRNITLYMDGEHELKDVGSLNTKGKSIFFTIVGGDTLKIYINHSKEDYSMFFRGKEYSLHQSKLKFNAYQHVDYYNTLCTEYKLLQEHQKLSFNFTLDKNKSDKSDLLYQRLNQILKQTNSEKTENSYNITPQALDSVLKNDPTLLDSDFCMRSGYSRFNIPCYIDSLLFVTYRHEEEDAGGAHAVWYTSEYSCIDMQTGKEIVFTDVIDVENPTYLKYLKRKIKNKDIPEDEDFPYFYITPNGIELIYQIQGLGARFFEEKIFLPYEDIQPFLKTDKYFDRKKK